MTLLPRLRLASTVNERPLVTGVNITNLDSQIFRRGSPGLLHVTAARQAWRLANIVPHWTHVAGQCRQNFCTQSAAHGRLETAESSLMLEACSPVRAVAGYAVNSVHSSSCSHAGRSFEQPVTLSNV